MGLFTVGHVLEMGIFYQGAYLQKGCFIVGHVLQRNTFTDGSTYNRIILDSNTFKYYSHSSCIRTSKENIKIYKFTVECVYNQYMFTVEFTANQTCLQPKLYHALNTIHWHHMFTGELRNKFYTANMVYNMFLTEGQFSSMAPYNAVSRNMFTVRLTNLLNVGPYNTKWPS